MKSWSHCMLDLETLGTRPGCAILSIGAIAFDPQSQTLGPSFYTIIGRRSCREAGLHEDRGTLEWWNRQTPEAQTVLVDAYSFATPTLTDALGQFSAFMQPFSSQTRVWGCGADFDNAILAHVYAVVGVPLPWRYTNNRCYRTLKNLVPAREQRKRHGVHHNALDDARHQATHAMECLAYLGKLYKQDTMQHLQASVAA